MAWIEESGSVGVSAASGALREAIELVVPVLDALGASVEVDLLETKWLLSDDFTADVANILAGGAGSEFTTDRLGGTVAAKTMVDPAKPDARVIVLNLPHVLGQDQPRSVADYIFLAAHEYCHVLQQSSRLAGGLPTTEPESDTPIHRSWRAIGRVVGDEYRADVVAGHVLAQLVTATDGTDSSRQASIADTFSLDHLAAAEDVILGLHPLLPDLVDSYRTREIDLEDLVRNLVRITEQALTQLAHWNAVCDLLGIDEPWDLGEIPNAAASQLYLRSNWQPLVAHLQNTPRSPSPEELSRNEPALLETAESAIAGLWASLGVSVEPLNEGDEYVHVGPPLR